MFQHFGHLTETSGWKNPNLQYKTQSSRDKRGHKIKRMHDAVQLYLGLLPGPMFAKINVKYHMVSCLQFCVQTINRNEMKCCIILRIKKNKIKIKATRFIPASDVPTHKLSSDTWEMTTVLPWQPLLHRFLGCFHRAV